jgi:hypothetical protein
MKIRVYSIVYDTMSPPEDCTHLPQELIFEVPEGFNVIDDGAELISEETGWLVHAFNYEELTEPNIPA